jgi:hypothetical protein
VFSGPFWVITDEAEGECADRDTSWSDLSESVDIGGKFRKSRLIEEGKHEMSLGDEAGELLSAQCVHKSSTSYTATFLPIKFEMYSGCSAVRSGQAQEAYPHSSIEIYERVHVKMCSSIVSVVQITVQGSRTKQNVWKRMTSKWQWQKAMTKTQRGSKQFTSL